MSGSNEDNRDVVPNSSVQQEDWVKTYWRPGMGWLYMAICAFDFIIFPIVAMLLPLLFHFFSIPGEYKPWQPLTLDNGGLIHLSFGAILGVTAWRRGQGSGPPN